MISNSRLKQAVGHALSGQWREAHEIVQDDEEGEIACWIHAVLHYQEGDLPNARYWYARCGRKLRTVVSPENELREIDAALKG
ncbi:MAG TPA: hypothetical protein VM140_08045 [Burkholderiales bacterium]|nr:hypothetical protein [Burkholderiales bacterium]